MAATVHHSIYQELCQNWHSSDDEYTASIAGVTQSMHNQLRIILMDIPLNGLSHMRIILGWMCVGSLPFPWVYDSITSNG